MIVVTRLNGVAFALNPDLVERVDSTPDTVITCIDGTRYVVREDIDVLIARIRDFRASIVVAAERLDHSTPTRTLQVVPRTPEA